MKDGGEMYNDGDDVKGNETPLCGLGQTNFIIDQLESRVIVRTRTLKLHEAQLQSKDQKNQAWA
jgi:hypothetical protein